ncbi:uncharacterized protein EHS24_005357 [Apiotrichum porosum]|uniref:Uncharacterized protein n=1 Tax=Apiotrichum porosum TaxID=105984 RepID=A0A427XD14_9TREE|nr:uncharacterized protein EHS24_005357 [Apiotrichum porosum]RSH76779.1 hypothetical protein EHS24_005357 [Apiotrichum porosum]
MKFSLLTLLPLLAVAAAAPAPAGEVAAGSNNLGRAPVDVPVQEERTIGALSGSVSGVIGGAVGIVGGVLGPAVSAVEAKCGIVGGAATSLVGLLCGIGYNQGGYVGGYSVNQWKGVGGLGSLPVTLTTEQITIIKTEIIPVIGTCVQGYGGIQGGTSSWSSGAAVQCVDSLW